ncbi:hypothetical protein [Candidatus Poriferisocius sp.]
MSAEEKLNKAANTLMGLGCALTIGIPVIIILIVIIIAVFDSLFG